jgi:hypothetical protein
MIIRDEDAVIRMKEVMVIYIYMTRMYIYINIAQVVLVGLFYFPQSLIQLILRHP